MIAGEGLVGVAIAGVVAARTYWPEAGFSQLLGRLHFADRSFTYLSGPAATVLGLALVLGLCVLLYRSGRAAESEPAH
jgi:hypothetical protein